MARTLTGLSQSQRAVVWAWSDHMGVTPEYLVTWLNRLQQVEDMWGMVDRMAAQLPSDR